MTHEDLYAALSDPYDGSTHQKMLRTMVGAALVRAGFRMSQICMIFAIKPITDSYATRHNRQIETSIAYRLIYEELVDQIEAFVRCDYVQGLIKPYFRVKLSAIEETYRTPAPAWALQAIPDPVSEHRIQSRAAYALLGARRRGVPCSDEALQFAIQRGLSARAYFENPKRRVSERDVGSREIQRRYQSLPKVGDPAWAEAELDETDEDVYPLVWSGQLEDGEGLQQGGGESDGGDHADDRGSGEGQDD